MLYYTYNIQQITTKNHTYLLHFGENEKGIEGNHMVETVSKRAVNTKESLKDSFIALYAQKPLQEITVKEITDLAGVNRGTFYLYYKDINSLLEEIEQSLIANLVHNCHLAIHVMMDGGQDFSRLLPQFEYYKKHASYFKALLGPYGDSSFMFRIKRAVKESLTARFHQDTTISYIIEYMTSAHFGIIVYWLERDMDLMPEQLVEIVSDMALHGGLQVLQKKCNAAIVTI